MGGADSLDLAVRGASHMIKELLRINKVLLLLNKYGEPPFVFQN